MIINRITIEVYGCDLCGKAFKNINSLEKHVRRCNKKISYAFTKDCKSMRISKKEAIEDWT